jgi:hypothetical protein
MIFILLLYFFSLWALWLRASPFFYKKIEDLFLNNSRTETQHHGGNFY